MTSLTADLHAPKNALLVDWTCRYRQTSKAALVMTEVLMLAGGVLLLALLAQVRFDIGLIPITGQTLGVLLVGAALGWDRGVTCVLCYLAIGFCGVPVFAKLAGTAAFFGPTSGFLLSFVPAAGVVGYLADRGWDRKVSTAIWTFLLGHVIVFAIGVTWLAFWLQDSSAAIGAGLIPFVPGMIVKTIAATALLPLAWQIRGRKS